MLDHPVGNVNLESVKRKYFDILDLFKSQYPTTADAAVMGKKYPHKSVELTKAAFTSKLKALRAKFRQAVDSSRKWTRPSCPFVLWALLRDMG